MKDYILQIKVKNGPLLRAMRHCGYYTAAELSRATGVRQDVIGKYLALKLAPTRPDGEIRPDALAIAGCLRRSIDDLFPPQHLTSPLAKNNAEVGMDLVQIGGLIASGPQSPLRLLEIKEGAAGLSNALRFLSPREERVIRRRFGIDTEESTLEQVAAEFGVGKERLYQIEAKALRRLRYLLEHRPRLAEKLQSLRSLPEET